jgi:TRAP-type C4-dicarboxylate transport system permease small subunit
MSLSALLACLSFYSAVYLFYYFFFKVQNPLFLFIAVGLLVFACFITPYSYEKRRKNYDRTMSFEPWWVIYPLITWWRLFILPISLLLSWFYSQ